MHLQLHHVSILTPEIEESIKFYCDALGMRLASRFHQDSGLNGAFLVDGPGSTSYTVQLVGPPFLGWMSDVFQRHGPSMGHHAFAVDNLDDWHLKLRFEGVEVLDAPGDFLGFRHMVFKDPSGTVVELVEGNRRDQESAATKGGRSQTGIDYFMHHISILCHDLAELERFYNRALHMQTVYDRRELGYILMGDPGFKVDKDPEAVTLEIMGDEAEWEREQAFLAKHGPGLDHLCFVVEDVDVAYRDLASRGVDFPYPPEDFETNRLAFFKDPSGVDVELMLPVPHKWASA